MKARAPYSAAVLAACLFVSGASALVYEVLWMRMLGLVLGHTVYATTTVLAAYMAGLGLGSYAFGRRSAGFPDPVRTYGLLEIGIGLYCALTPVLFWLASGLYVNLHATLIASYATFSFVQFVLVVAMLLVPTALMGATLPLLVQALVRSERDIARTVGMLYVVNTFGAVVGVVLAGYVLLPVFGNHAVLWAAATANVAIGLVAIRYGANASAAQAQVPHARAKVGAHRRPAPDGDRRPVGPAEARLIGIALAVSGLVSMVYEVAWTRALALVIGSSTYAFSAMLVAFLTGLAAGAAAYTHFRGSRRAGAATFAILQAGIGLSAVLVVLIFERTPEALLLALQRSQSPAFVQAVQIMVSGLALLGPALLIGATFPCAMAACASTVERAGAEAGRLYALNTIGAIGGTVLAGFLLVPAIGVHAAIAAGIATNFLLAAVLMAAPLRNVPGRQWAAAIGCLAAGAGVFFLPQWSAGVMTSGAAIYANEYLPSARDGTMTSVLKGREVIFYRDGPSATVAVVRANGITSLSVNGKVDASNYAADMPTQIMLGHVPLLIHPHPRDVLVIGLGSGITAGAVARHPIERMDVVEIEPAVVEASRYFVRENHDVLGDRRTRLIVADARNFLLTAPGEYDVITSEPSNPWIGGVASLFSREFFTLARARLRPGGVMVQWVHGYSLAPADMSMIVATFRAVFPATSIWQVASGDYLLVGRAEVAPLDLNSIKARWAALGGVREDFQRMRFDDWRSVLGYFLLAEADVARMPGDRINTDDWLGLEFSAPRGLLLDTMAANYQALVRFRTSVLPAITPASAAEIEHAEARYAIGLVPYSQLRWIDALLWFQRAIELDADYMPPVLMAAEASLRLGRSDDALAFARRVLSREPQNADAMSVVTQALQRLTPATAATP